MRKRRIWVNAVLVNLTFLATDALSCSVCVTALVDYFLPPIYLWVLIATTWFVLNAVVSSVTGITLKWYPKNIVLVLSIVIVITLLLLAGTFFGFGLMLVLFAPAIAAFVQSFNPRLRSDFPGGIRTIYWIGVSHLIGVACAAVLMMHTHLTRTPEKFIIDWEFTYIAKQKFQELEAQRPQSLAAFRYIKENGGERIASMAAERIKEIEGSQKYVRQSDQVPRQNEKIENATSQADGEILLPEKITNTIGMTFVYIKPGTYMMGSPASETRRDNDETQHQVTLTRGSYMQTTEATQGQWLAVMGSNPSYFKNCGSDCPVEQVSWNDVQEFIRRLNQKEGVSSYRLPTEAEWEYAARSGDRQEQYAGTDNESNLGDYAWYDGNSSSKTHSVGQKRPNGLGLYDMSGNVWEWVQDWKGDYPSGSVTNPAGPLSGSRRVSRGGGWLRDAGLCRSADRNDSTPDYRSSLIGFRLSRTK